MILHKLDTTSSRNNKTNIKAEQPPMTCMVRVDDTRLSIRNNTCIVEGQTPFSAVFIHMFARSRHLTVPRRRKTPVTTLPHDHGSTLTGSLFYI